MQNGLPFIVDKKENKQTENAVKSAILQYFLSFLHYFKIFSYAILKYIGYLCANIFFAVAQVVISKVKVTEVVYEAENQNAVF